MGVFIRPDSPYYWLLLERPRQAALREKTRIRHDAPTTTLRKDARELADLRYHERMMELAKHAAGLTPKPRITFRTYAKWYQDTVTPTKRSKDRERSVIAQLKDWFGNTELTAIDKASVQEWRADRLQHVAPATVDRETDVLKSMLREAVPKYLAASPIAGLRRHRETVQSKKRRPRILSHDEERRLVAAATTPVETAIVLLALDTLMRLSDIRTLRRDRDAKTYIHVEAPKIDPYDVEVSARVRAALDALPKHGPFYFPRRWASSKPQPMSANTVWRIFRDLCVRAKIPVGRKERGVTFHSLRHTGTTRLLETGTNPINVMEQGGWTSLRQLVRYGHGSREGKREMIEARAITPESRSSPK